ncbi:uncharacterized protein VP01_1822g9 [Puccinia sorghi]|uniref:BED-type domain-containing protein n=1 Tax=Puccinia sorghi TaxID=27349 RepID=A0A0L6VFW3_9BASI|nr:uncharacterized protein VP01_1822g9 [Puccinia sorghi]
MKRKNPPRHPKTYPTRKSSLKRSWVWNHLKVSSGPGFVICQVITKSGSICREKLWKDKSGSTKNLHRHLAQIYSLANLNLNKNTKTLHMDLSKGHQILSW